MEKEGCFYRQPFEWTTEINLLEVFKDQWMGMHEREVMKWMVEIKSQKRCKDQQSRIDAPKICHAWKIYDVDDYDT